MRAAMMAACKKPYIMALTFARSMLSGKVVRHPRPRHTINAYGILQTLHVYSHGPPENQALTVASFMLSGTIIRMTFRALISASTATTPAATAQPANALLMDTPRPSTCRASPQVRRVLWMNVLVDERKSLPLPLFKEGFPALWLVVCCGLLVTSPLPYQP